MELRMARGQDRHAGGGRGRTHDAVSRSFPLSYKLAWLPRLLLAGRGTMAPFPAAPLSRPTPENAKDCKRILFLGDLSAVANRRPPQFCDGFRALCRSADI